MFSLFPSFLFFRATSSTHVPLLFFLYFLISYFSLPLHTPLQNVPHTSNPSLIPQSLCIFFFFFDSLKANDDEVYASLFSSFFFISLFRLSFFILFFSHSREDDDDEDEDDWNIRILGGFWDFGFFFFFFFFGWILGLILSWFCFGLILSWVWDGFPMGFELILSCFVLILSYFWFGLVLLILCLDYQMLKWVLLIMVVDRWGCAVFVAVRWEEWASSMRTEDFLSSVIW